MTELMTLKDLKIENENLICENCDAEFAIGRNSQGESLMYDDKNIDENFVYPSYVEYEKLRKEAIKIIKAFKEFENRKEGNWSFNGQIEKLKQLGIYDFYDIETGDNSKLLDFIYWFFNLNKEELVTDKELKYEKELERGNY